MQLGKWPPLELRDTPKITEIYMCVRVYEGRSFSFRRTTRGRGGKERWKEGTIGIDNLSSFFFHSVFILFN